MEEVVAILDKRAGSCLPPEFMDILSKPQILACKNRFYKYSGLGERGFGYEEFLSLFFRMKNQSEVAGYLKISRQALNESFGKYIRPVFDHCPDGSWEEWKKKQKRIRQIEMVNNQAEQSLVGKIAKEAMEHNLDVRYVVRKTYPYVSKRQLVIEGKKCYLVFSESVLKSVVGSSCSYLAHAVSGKRLRSEKYDFLLMSYVVSGKIDRIFIIPIMELLLSFREHYEDASKWPYYRFYVPLKNNKRRHHKKEFIEKEIPDKTEKTDIEGEVRFGSQGCGSRVLAYERTWHILKS